MFVLKLFGIKAFIFLSKTILLKQRQQFSQLIIINTLAETQLFRFWVHAISIAKIVTTLLYIDQPSDVSIPWNKDAYVEYQLPHNFV